MSTLPWRHELRALATTVAMLGSTLLAQGRTDYMNVESPQVSPLATATVGSRTLLLVCNTPDNSLEVWDTDETITPVAARFVARVPVGLEPVSVLAVGDRFWTANFLGDSVTAGVIEPTTGGALRARITAMRNLPAPAGFQRGDEPMDLAFRDFTAQSGPQVLLVSLFSSSAVAALDAVTLAPLGAPVDALAPATGSATPHGVKEPRAIRIRNDDVFVLASKGGITPGTNAPSLHDLDVLRGTVSATGVSFAAGTALGDMGSTNLNLRLASNGDLYVVGAEAETFASDDQPTARTMATGFVRSTLYRHAAGTTFERDANLTSGQVTVLKTGAAGEGKPASMLTDLVLVESGGAVTKVYAAAMGNDRVVTFAPPTGSAATSPDVKFWIRSTIDLPGTTLNSGPRFGPRGLVHVQTSNGPRLYVLNRLDNSIVTIDTTTDTVLAAQSFALNADPTPSYVKTGRRFLYDAEISGNGFVSCASCHVDGRTDALVWRLGNRHKIVQPGVPPHLPPTAAFVTSLFGTGTNFSGITGGAVTFTSDPDYESAAATDLTFDPAVPGDLDSADDKREMVTQSLQGLLNFELALDAKDLVTNAPFHWRGDKPSVADFNEAFVTLLDTANIGTTGTGPLGLTDGDVKTFEAFVHSITYPPNPKQRLDRTYPSGSAARAGLEAYHNQPGTLANRSCAQCHTLPEGSNNRFTVMAPEFPLVGFTTLANRQPIESAALRGLFQKEPLLEAGGQTVSASAPIVGHFGLNHNGIQQLTANPDSSNVPQTLTSINSFVDLFLNQFTGTATPAPMLNDIKQFVHEMDWGVAPMVGEVGFVDAAVLASQTLQAIEIARILAIQMQANLANAGAVVWVLRPNHTTQPRRGFRWSPTVQRWIEEPTFAQLTSVDVLNLFTDPQDTIVTMSVPLGSERRVASLFGPPVPPPLNLQPQNVALVGLATNTAYVDVPSFDDNWIPDWWTNASLPPGTTTPPSTYFSFVFPDHFVSSTQQTPVDDVFSKTLRLYQFGLLDGQNGSGVSYGLPRLRHEAPRRLRVRGDLILMGATLQFSIPDPPAGWLGGPPSGWAALSNPPMRGVEIPLHPTALTSEGKPVWETCVEFDPLVTYQLMLGGLAAPGVAATITDVNSSTHNATTPAIVEPTPASGAQPFALPYLPNDWNWYRIAVRNPGTGGTLTSTPVFAQLKLL